MSNENTRPSLMNMKHVVFAKTKKGKKKKKSWCSKPPKEFMYKNETVCSANLVPY
jgi:hypothetical protein